MSACLAWEGGAGRRMDRETAARLIGLNTAFYAENAVSFSESRRDIWPGWKRVLRLARGLVHLLPQPDDLLLPVSALKRTGQETLWGVMESLVEKGTEEGAEDGQEDNR